MSEAQTVQNDTNLNSTDNNLLNDIDSGQKKSFDALHL